MCLLPQRRQNHHSRRARAPPRHPRRPPPPRKVTPRQLRLHRRLLRSTRSSPSSPSCPCRLQVRRVSPSAACRGFHRCACGRRRVGVRRQTTRPMTTRQTPNRSWRRSQWPQPGGRGPRRRSSPLRLHHRGPMRSRPAARPPRCSVRHRRRVHQPRRSPIATWNRSRPRSVRRCLPWSRCRLHHARWRLQPWSPRRRQRAWTMSQAPMQVLQGVEAPASSCRRACRGHLFRSRNRLRRFHHSKHHSSLLPRSRPACRRLPRRSSMCPPLSCGRLVGRTATRRSLRSWGPNSRPTPHHPHHPPPRPPQRTPGRRSSARRAVQRSTPPRRLRRPAEGSPAVQAVRAPRCRLLPSEAPGCHGARRFLRSRKLRRQKATQKKARGRRRSRIVG